MIDIHTHILPNVDDGSDSLETSIYLLKQEIKEGINKVVLTPHQNKQSLDKDGLVKTYLEFKEKVKDLPLELFLGSEVYYYSGLKEDLKNDKVLTIMNTKYFLIEFSTRIEYNIKDILYDFSILGYKPIIAHIERYDYLTKEDYLDISKYALIQVNSASFFNRNYKKICMYLLKNNLIDFIASDCHDRFRDVSFLKTYKLIRKKNNDLYEKILKNEHIFQL